MGLGQRAGGQEKWVEGVHLQSLLSARDGDQGHSGRGDRGRAGGRQACGSYSYRRQRHRRGRRVLSAGSSGAAGGTVLAVLWSTAPVRTADLDRCPGKTELSETTATRIPGAPPVSQAPGPGIEQHRHVRKQFSGDRRLPLTWFKRSELKRFTKLQSPRQGATSDGRF